MEMEKSLWRSLRELWQGQVSYEMFKLWSRSNPYLNLCSGKMNESDIQKMVDKVDIDNDGSIDFKEFKKMME